MVGFFGLLSAIAKKHIMMTHHEVPPQRTRAPLRLSQGSVADINMVPVILAEDAGSLLKSVTERQTVVAVGRYSLQGLDFTRCYLSQDEGAYLHFACRSDHILETRLYQPYAEVIPATADEWRFWLDDTDGYIGYPIMQSKDEDGPLQYQRTWSASNERIAPMQAVEWIVDIDGASTRAQHQMMHYSRSLNASVTEHLLVSAVEMNDGMSVNFWLGIDVTTPELAVFPAADAPQ